MVKGCKDQIEKSTNKNKYILSSLKTYSSSVTTPIRLSLTKMTTNNHAMQTNSPFQQQHSFYYNSKAINNTSYYGSMPFNAYDMSPSLSSNSSGYSSTDSLLLGGSNFNSPNNYSQYSMDRPSPYPFSPSIYNSYSIAYNQVNQQQATVTSSPNYLLPLQVNIF